MVFSLPSGKLEAALDEAAELSGAEELAGVEEGATELADDETGDVGTGSLLPPLPPQAVRPATIRERAQVFIRDCIEFPSSIVVILGCLIDI
jgi:hypothetical protein